MLKVNQLIGFGARRAGGGSPIGIVNYIGTEDANGTITYTDAPVGPAQAGRQVVVALAREGGSTTGVVAGGVTLTLRGTTSFVGTVLCTMEIWSGVVPTGTTATVVATLTGLAQIFVYTVYGCDAEPLDIVSQGGSDTSIELNNIAAEIDGGVIGFFGYYVSASTVSEAWSGSETSIEDSDALLPSSTNARIALCHFDTTADLAASDLVATLDASASHAGIAISFGPSVPTIYDLTNPTGAWSLSRDLFRAPQPSRYAQTGGAITTIYDQSENARDVTDGAVSTRRPAETTAGPNSRTCADFDGSSDYLTGSDMNEHVGNTNAFIVMSVIFDVVSTAVTGDFASIGHAAISDDTGRIGLFGCVDGIDKVFASNYSGGSVDQHVGQAVTETQAHVITLRHEGGNLYVSVDGAAETSIASGDTNGDMGALRFGYRGNAYFDGKLFEAITFSTVPGSSDRDAIVDDFMAHVGI